jgi:hypothetical protein
MTIDVGGQLLFLFGFGLLVLAFTWAGATYDWNTAAVLAPLCIGALLAFSFVCWEHYMAPGNVLSRKWPFQKSMLPWQLIINRDIGLLCYITFATGVAMYAVSISIRVGRGDRTDKADVARSSTSAISISPWLR